MTPSFSGASSALLAASDAGEIAAPLRLFGDQGLVGEFGSVMGYPARGYKRYAGGAFSIAGYAEPAGACISISFLPSLG